MDLIFMGNTHFFILDRRDCQKITKVGFKYFDIIFSPIDWKRITDLPDDGLFFYHESPDVKLLLLYACTREYSEQQKMESVGIYYRKIFNKMILDRKPFPRLDAKESIFD